MFSVPVFLVAVAIGVSGLVWFGQNIYSALIWIGLAFYGQAFIRNRIRHSSKQQGNTTQSDPTGD